MHRDPEILGQGRRLIMLRAGETVWRWSRSPAQLVYHYRLSYNVYIYIYIYTYTYVREISHIIHVYIYIRVFTHI